MHKLDAPAPTPDAKNNHSSSAINCLCSALLSFDSQSAESHVWRFRIHTTAENSTVQVHATYLRRVGIEEQRVGVAPNYSPRGVIA